MCSGSGKAAEREQRLHSEPSSQKEALSQDVRAAALLDQLNAVDARRQGLEGARAWGIPLSSVLIVIAMGMIGIGYRDPMGILIYSSIVICPLVDFVMRRRARRSLLREREQVLTQHEELVRLTAMYQDTEADVFLAE